MAGAETTVIGDWSIRVGLAAALRGAAVDPGVLDRWPAPRVAAAAEAVAEGERLLRPRVLVRELPVVGRHGALLELEEGSLSCGPSAATRLALVERLVVMVCTVGNALERRVSELFGADPFRAVIMDGLGSAAVDLLLTQACERLLYGREAEGLPGVVYCRPGSDEWPAAEAQPRIFDLVDPRRDLEDVVRLLPSGVMRPLKSVSLLAGLSRRAEQTRCPDEECESCALASACRYRPVRRSPAGG